MTKADIAGFWKVFRKFDKDREGTISMETFFRDICKEERNLFGDAIFELIDTEDTAVIEFGEVSKFRTDRKGRMERRTDGAKDGWRRSDSKCNIPHRIFT